MQWAWATSLDQLWRSPSFPMWATLIAAGFFALVVLIVQALILSLPLLIVLAGLVYGVWYLVAKLPPYFKIAQDYAALAAQVVKLGAARVANPIVQTKALIAGAKQLAKSVHNSLGHK